MFYEVVKVVVPVYTDEGLVSQVRYSLKVNGGSSLPMVFDDEDKAIDYADNLIKKVGER